MTANEDLFDAVKRENDLTAERRIAQIRAAIDAGADVNARREYGFTPLHDAVESPWKASMSPADPMVVRKLIELDADVNATNDAGIRPLNYAIARNDTDSPDAIEASKQVIALLREHGAEPGGGGDHLAHSVCCDPSLYELLLEIDGDVDTPDEEGNTPLHNAVFAQRPATVRILLDRGVDVDALNAKRKTPLGLALKGDDYSKQQQQNKQLLVEMLEAVGAKARPPRAKKTTTTKKEKKAARKKATKK